MLPRGGEAVSRSLSSIVRRDVSGLCREFDCLAVPLRAPAQEVLVETSQGKSCRVDLASRALLVLLFRTRCLTRYRLQQQSFFFSFFHDAQGSV